MRKLKKLLAALITLSMLAGMLPALPVLAAGENVCQIGDVEYTSLAAAVAAANADDVIWMTANDSTPKQNITIDKSLTIELEGKDLSYTKMEFTGAGTKAVLTDRVGGAKLNSGDNYDDCDPFGPTISLI